MDFDRLGLVYIIIPPIKIRNSVSLSEYRAKMVAMYFKLLESYMCNEVEHIFLLAQSLLSVLGRTD